MDFKETKAIYLQIVDHLCEKILNGEFDVRLKIPSIREVAVELEVNPNTVQRSFDFLQQNLIIEMKRGIGFFILPESKERVLELRKKNFNEIILPKIWKEMELLFISSDELLEMIENLKKRKTK